MAQSRGNGGGESLSLQTLVIAAAASAAAAVVVSHLWKDGTVIAAAMTPVIVTIVKEMLARPMESEIVRKPVQRIASTSRRVVVPARAGERARVEPRGTIPGDPDPGWQSGPEPPTDPGPSTPIRTYGPPRRRPIHVKVAIVTGLLAFVIAAAALTLPELLFGGAVSSHRDTTLFGGGGSKSDDKKDDAGDRGQPNERKPEGQTTTPAAPAPESDGKSPTTTTPAPTSPEQPPPEETTPQQTSPLPPSPAPPVP